MKHLASWLPVLAGTVLTVFAGCHAEHPQSMLHPASSAAGAIAWLWWFLLAVCGGVFLAVVGLAAWAVSLPRQAPGERSWKPPFILFSGAVIPSVILFAILLVSVGTQRALRTPESELTVRVTGHQWWWEVQYPEASVETANEIHIPVGKPVRVELRTADVIHSLWIPRLQGKHDMIPDKTNVTWLEADRQGIYRGQCAEYCGAQHAGMRLVVVALPGKEFERWLTERQEADSEPVTEQQRRGRAVFRSAGCNNCHSIGQDVAKSKRGPNLTHLGQRRTIAAGLLENNAENLARWIRHPQSVKPGNLMPRTPLAEEDLSALVMYLRSLK